MPKPGSVLTCHLARISRRLAMKRTGVGHGAPEKSRVSRIKKARAKAGVARVSKSVVDARAPAKLVESPQQSVLMNVFDQVIEVVVVRAPGKHIVQLKPTALAQLRDLTYSDEEIHALVVPKRTLARRLAQDEPLSVEETDKAVRLARIGKMASDVFGDRNKAHRWLRKSKRALNGETPLAYLATEAGARAIEEMLNQIDHGILP